MNNKMVDTSGTGNVRVYSNIMLDFILKLISNK